MQATTTDDVVKTGARIKRAGFLKFGVVLGAHAAFMAAIDALMADPDAAAFIAASGLKDDLLELSRSTEDPMFDLIQGVGLAMAD